MYANPVILGGLFTNGKYVGMWLPMLNCLYCKCLSVMCYHQMSSTSTTSFKFMIGLHLGSFTCVLM